MNRFQSPLDARVQSAMIDVCEDLSLDIPTIAQEIVEEFEESSQPASRESIVKELTEARAIQIQENKLSDRLYVEAE